MSWGTELWVSPGSSHCVWDPPPPLVCRGGFPGGAERPRGALFGVESGRGRAEAGRAAGGRREGVAKGGGGGAGGRWGGRGGGAEAGRGARGCASSGSGARAARAAMALGEGPGARAARRPPGDRNGRLRWGRAPARAEGGGRAVPGKHRAAPESKSLRAAPLIGSSSCGALSLSAAQNVG